MNGMIESGMREGTGEVLLQNLLSQVDGLASRLESIPGGIKSSMNDFMYILTLPRCYKSGIAKLAGISNYKELAVELAKAGYIEFLPKRWYHSLFSQRNYRITERGKGFLASREFHTPPITDFC